MHWGCQSQLLSPSADGHEGPALDWHLRRPVGGVMRCASMLTTAAAHYPYK